jgi:hypothetical protein
MILLKFGKRMIEKSSLPHKHFAERKRPENLGKLESEICQNLDVRKLAT